MSERTQVLLYTSYLHIIGGIETFILNWIDLMNPYYDIAVMCPTIPDEMAMRILSKVPLYRGDADISCDTLIMIRMGDHIPKGVTYAHSIRMCHACKSNPSWRIRPDCDKIVHVSKASKKSFETDGDVIYNPVIHDQRNALLLVSATRIPASDKGANTDRMLRLAQMLNDAEIPFMWFNFSDKPIGCAPPGLVNVGTYHDLQPYISRADYLVQLSDQEGFGYSVAEALVNQTAVIVTPFETTKELNIKDGVNGYVIPFDMDFDVRKLLRIPQFNYTYDNETIIKQWRKLLGNTRPMKNYKPQRVVLVEVVSRYEDLMLNKVLTPGTKIKVFEDRAKLLCDDLQLCKRLRTIGGGYGEVQNT